MSIKPLGGFGLASGAGDTLPIVDTIALVKGSADATKLVRIEADGLTTATTRVITMADQDIDLTPDTGTFAAAGGGGAGLLFLSEVTASASATVDLETTFDSTFDAYLIIATGVTFSESNSLKVRMKLGGTYDAGNNYKYHNHRMLSSATTYAANASAGDSSITINGSTGGAAGSSVQFRLAVSNVISTTLTKHLYWQTAALSSVNHTEGSVGSGHNTSTVNTLTGIRFLPASGTITVGTFRLYGVTNS